MYAISAVLAAAGFGLVVGLAGGGWGMWAWNDWTEAREERAVALAQADVAKANDAARKAIEEGFEQRAAGFAEGVAKGKQQAARVGTRVAQVTQGSGFAPNCVAGPDGFALYKAALGAVTGGKVPDELLTVTTAPLSQPSPAVPNPAPVAAPPPVTSSAPTTRPKPTPIKP